MITTEVPVLISAGVLLCSGVGKAANFARTSASLEGSFALRPHVATRLNAALIVVETAIALMLLSPLRVAGLVSASLLFGAFLAYTAFIVISGRERTCMCFGQSARRIGWPTVVRNALLLAIAAYGAYLVANGGVLDLRRELATKVLIAAYFVLLFWAWAQVFEDESQRKDVVA
ncbi:hypothetical protein H1W00_09490 [Aeromicrobium sp. Marseille-Q0843]|uniref:Methylamine utilisation protein MauE domain-containing protein n=1 Tax=Aeromicrobium phoceense TaxID=2754045 RepID=A0A838XNX9_9ACTN|nr:MauE/DoxX family redox-associated membrane protein [Aeromicrobium phoceense]MBA4608704.1 hypothetical protein [Aeromicrobium phoceense]